MNNDTVGPRFSASISTVEETVQIVVPTTRRLANLGELFDARSRQRLHQRFLYQVDSIRSIEIYPEQFSRTFQRHDERR